MLNFEDTKIAFQNKSNGDLRWTGFLFKSLARPSLVQFGKVITNVALKSQMPIGWVIKPTLYKHFVGGETIEKCQPVVKELAQYNVKSILDYSVEGTDKEEAIESALEETLRSVRNAANDENIPFAVFKPTAFGESTMLQKVSENSPLTLHDEQQKEKFYRRIDLLCKTAYENNISILIDAEDYAYQAYIDTVVEEMMQKYNKTSAVVFNTLQMYRVDRLDFLKASISKARSQGYYYGVKFVRGAYLEKERERAYQMGYEDPIQPDKESTDADYNAALKYSVENIDIVSVFNGTHNEYSSRYLTELMEDHNIERSDNRVWFSQLYGMSDHISFNLAAEGYNVAKYLPYGPVKHVLPYLIRRAEENTSVKGQTSRELMLITQEKKRRKKEKKMK
ncbi:MAG: proline dehydrogenase family protein [Bacteroidales bacterium]